MQQIHMHLPNWMHFSKMNWHTLGDHLSHIVRDPRFWAAVALIILFGLMILTTMLTKPGIQSGPQPSHPIYPYLP